MDCCVRDVQMEGRAREGQSGCDGFMLQEYEDMSYGLQACDFSQRRECDIGVWVLWHLVPNIEASITFKCCCDRSVIDLSSK
jgi:hypothetical protein